MPDSWAAVRRTRLLGNVVEDVGRLCSLRLPRRFWQRSSGLRLKTRFKATMWSGPGIRAWMAGGPSLLSDHMQSLNALGRTQRMAMPSDRRDLPQNLYIAYAMA